MPRQGLLYGGLGGPGLAEGEHAPVGIAVTVGLDGQKLAEALGGLELIQGRAARFSGMQQIVHGLIGKFGGGGISHRDVRAAIDVRGIGSAGAPGAIGGQAAGMGALLFRHLDGLHRPALQQHGVERMGRLRGEGHGPRPRKRVFRLAEGPLLKVSRRQPSSAKVFARLARRALRTAS